MVTGWWKSRWMLTGLGALAIGGLIWLFGPFLGPLSGLGGRIGALLGVGLVWAVANTVLDRLRRRTEQALVSGITGEAAPGTGAGAASEEVEALRARMKRALAILQRARPIRGYLYEQPWYVIIGPPGSGKTTALANSGLRFPLADQLGEGEVQGIGGTRLCDWTFTEQAVLIDTAGRYTTQDSAPATDRAGWEGFLDLLRRTRSRQPLNGVIVAIAIDEIATTDQAGRATHAKAIRARIRELNHKLGVRLPVYLIFTKLDLIGGFTEFFDDLDRDGRAQVWGVTFPPGEDPQGHADGFPAAFNSLIGRLGARLNDRLQAERNLERRTRLIGFPAEMASLAAPLADFVTEAFGGTRLDPAPRLRGVYFASATQQGHPIDRVCASLAHGFGLDRRGLPQAPGQSGRSYFLQRLLAGVIFGEAMLVSLAPAAARRRRLARIAALAGCAALATAACASLALTATRSDHQIQQVGDALDAYAAAYRTLGETQSLDRVPLGGSDLMQILPVLDRARAVVEAAETEPAGLGLSQRPMLVQSARRLYGRALNDLLRPRLVSLLEARLRSHAGDTDYVYRATGPYKMLCNLLPADPAALRAWFDSELAASFAGASLAERRTALAAHAAVLFARDPALFPPMMPELDHDPELTDVAEAKIGTMSVSDVAYAAILARPVPAEVTDFIPEKAIGPSARGWFVRRSGKPLGTPVPGLFTPAGFAKVLRPRLSEAVDRAIRESGVRGREGAIDPNDATRRQQIERAVIRLYTDQYIAAWDQLLGDLDLVPPQQRDDAIGGFAVVTSETGPVMRLLGAVVPLLAVAPAASAGDDDALSGAAIDRHFEDLRTYVANGDLLANLKTLGRVQTQIEQMTLSGAPPSASATAARELAGTVAAAPEPAHRWLTSLASRGQAMQSATQREQAAAAFSGGSDSPQAQCQRVTTLFPFRPGVGREASLEDFAALFGRDGGLDGFFTRQIRPFVATGPGPWRTHPVGDVAAPLDDTAAQSFERAAEIRDAFFAGGTSPQIRFALRPIGFSPGTQRVTIDFHGLRRSFTAGETASAEPFTWPGLAGRESVRIEFEPPGDGPALEQTGNWALFRLLHSVRVQPGDGPRSQRVTFTQGARQVTFVLSTDTMHSPFRPGLLDGFACPSLRR